MRPPTAPTPWTRRFLWLGTPSTKTCTSPTLTTSACWSIPCRSRTYPITAGVLNSASLIIYAVDTVTIGGTIKSGDKVTLTIGTASTSATECYTPLLYTVQSASTTSIASMDSSTGNAAQRQRDINAIATADTRANAIVLTARAPGAAGNSVSVTTSTSASSQITAVAPTFNFKGGGSAASVAPRQYRARARGACARARGSRRRRLITIITRIILITMYILGGSYYTNIRGRTTQMKEYTETRNE